MFKNLKESKLLTSNAFSDGRKLLFTQAVVLIVNFLTLRLVATHLGPSSFGFVSLASTFTAISFAFTSALDAFYLWEYAHNKNYKTITSLTRVKFIINIFTLFLAILFSFIYLENTNESLSMILVLFISSASNTLGHYPSVLLYNKQANEFAVTSIINLFIITSLRVLAVYLGAGPLIFAVFAALEASFIFLNLKFRNLIHQEHHLNLLSFGKSDLITYTREISLAKWHILTVYSSLFITRLDQLVIKSVLGNHDLGMYTAATKLIEYPQFISTIITNLIIPRISNSAEKEVKKMTVFFASWIFALVSLGISVVFLISGDFLVTFVFGKDFTLTSEIVKILAFGIPGLWLYNFISILFASAKKMHLTFISTIISGILYAPMLTYFTKSVGVIGSAYALTVSYTFVGILSLIIYLVFVKAPKIPLQYD